MPDLPVVLESLPVHGAPSPSATSHRLRVSGLVRTPVSLTVAQLERFPQELLTEDFTCEEGWTVPSQRWRGVCVRDLLDAARVSTATACVEFAAGEFRFTLPMDQARRALVALRLNDEQLTRWQGGPMRLVVPGAACFTSIKWLEQICVRHDRGTNRAKRIALARITPSATE
ncbi:MAG: molybdopterin-dependent oxidoreductase [Myxococcales bacterium]|nr:molybdopterin-dependent oxidoreductase [Myxococcales bacterium]